MIMDAKPTNRQEILREFGLHVRDLRKSLGLSQEALATEAGFSRSYYSEIELGKRNISILNMCKLAKCLHVSLKTLVDFDSIGCD
jgi:transcriptional regulator with XRE-family HTH domain